MKSMLLRSLWFALSLFVMSNASAGLIIGNKEFLEIEVTKGLSVAGVESLIASNSMYNGYELATDVDMAMLWNSLPNTTYNGNQWLAFNSASLSSQSLNILSWFLGGDPTYQYSSDWTYSSPTGLIRADEYHYGYISYRDSITNAFESGFYNIMAKDGVGVGLYNRVDYYNLGDTSTSSGNRSNGVGPYNSSLFVRSVNVPEPSTLAIFALGMIGLASRRFKK